ncbi:hypothetical protein [Chromobacterium violaceum]|nr:hypothetical protein [Chromobacterium violaceum]
MTEQGRKRITDARARIGTAAEKTLTDLREFLDKVDNLPDEQKALPLEITKSLIALLEESVRGVIEIGDALEQIDTEISHE